MSTGRPHLKKATGVPTLVQQKTVGNKVYQTRLTTATAQASKHIKHISQPSSGDGTSEIDVANPLFTLLSNIADELACITQEESLKPSVKKRLEELAEYARDSEAEKRRLEDALKGQVKVSAFCYVIRQDLERMFDGLVKHINGAQGTLNTAVQSNADKVLKEVEESVALAKDLACKVGKVSKTTNKIASEAGPYWDALLAEPKRSNRSNTDPRILGDID